MPTSTDSHLERVIRRTIRIAGLSGRDCATQDEIAVRTVRWMRPDMVASEALNVVKQIRMEMAETASSDRLDEASTGSLM